MAKEMGNSSEEVNVGDLNKSLQETLIHINLTKTFYSIDPAELDILEQGSISMWKDITIATIGLGLPCTINACIEYQKQISSNAPALNAEVFWNSLVAGIAIVLAIIFGILWWRSENSCKNLISAIKARPKYKM